MSAPVPLRTSRTTRALSRLLAAFALVLSVAAPLHGLLHEHGHGHEGEQSAVGIEAPGHSHASSAFEADCPLCTLSHAPALTAEARLSVEPIGPLSLQAPRAVALASRQGAAAPARGPPAPTC